jgi:transposase-like protein
MAKKSHSPELIINKLREAEILLNQGASVGEASRKIGITEQTYYRWRKEYGGMRTEQAKRLKSLEKENTRLKKLVADLSLDISILKEAARGNF